MVIDAVRPLGHDLDGLAVLAADHDPDEPEAQPVQHGLDDTGDLGGKARLANETRAIRTVAFAIHVRSKNPWILEACLP